MYIEWTLDTTSAFLIFSKITDCYTYMKEVQRLCHYNEFWVAIKTRFFEFNVWTPGIVTRLETDWELVIKWFFIAWYSIWWSTMEDTGIAVGFFVSLMLDLHLEDVVGNNATDKTWDCAQYAPYSFFSEVTDKEYSIRHFWN